MSIKRELQAERREEQAVNREEQRRAIGTPSPKKPAVPQTGIREDMPEKGPRKPTPAEEAEMRRVPRRPVSEPVLPVLVVPKPTDPGRRRIIKADFGITKQDGRYLIPSGTKKGPE